MQVGGIYEQRDAQSVTYILEDASLFFATGYKVLKSQEGNGFVKCNHLTHNGKDKLVYDISKYKVLSSLATTLDSVAFLSVFINLLDSVINAKNNGFMQYDNIDLSFENIYVDFNNYKVYLIYIPIELGMYSNDILFYEERFRYSASSFFENYFQNPDENIMFISSVVTASEYRLEDMKQMLYERLQVINVQSSNYNAIDNNYNGVMSGNTGRINTGGMPGNNASMEARRKNNNPMRNSNGSVSETMDISDILKQIRKNGYYDQIGENTCFEDLDGYGNSPDSRNTNANNRLNLGGTPGSMSKANISGMNNLSNSGIIPNVKQHRQGHNTNDNGRYPEDRYHDRHAGDRYNDRHIGDRYHDRPDDRYNDRYDDRYDDRERGGNRDNRGYDERSINRGYDRDNDRNHRYDRHNDRGRNEEHSRSRMRDDGRRNNHNMDRPVGRTINATIRLVSDINSGEIELIIDREEFLIGKNFNVVEGFIPHNEGISRVHCKIIYERGSYHIVNMGSLNGTYVNGARIPVKSRVPISIGDKIGIANIEFTVETL